jgi:DNA uptake protein ComE-like DNA-binding protein
MKRTLTGSILCAALLPVLGCDSADDQLEKQAAPAESAPAAPTPLAEGAFLDPNTATHEELVATPGVDAAIADAIVASRPYDDMVAVDVVVGDGLTDVQKDAVYEQIWMPLDLNSTAEEDFLLIPGVGPRMAHEFEEYRPYDAIERWRREMGKYVDAEEITRMERYVIIR